MGFWKLFPFFSTTNRSWDRRGVFEYSPPPPPVGDGKSGVPVGRGLTLAGTGGGDATPLEFSENNSRTDGPIARHETWYTYYLTNQQFYIFPGNIKSVPTMTFDLWPDFQGLVKRNLRSVPLQRLEPANFGMFAGDMDMDRCREVTSMVYTGIVTFPRSAEVIRGQWPLMTSYVIFLWPKGIA